MGNGTSSEEKGDSTIAIRVKEWDNIKFGTYTFGGGSGGAGLYDVMSGGKGSVGHRVDKIVRTVGGALRLKIASGGYPEESIHNLKESLPGKQNGKQLRVDAGAIRSMNESFEGIAGGMGITGGDIYGGIIGGMHDDVKNMEDAFDKKSRALVGILAEAEVVLKEIENSKNRIRQKMRDSPGNGQLEQELALIEELKTLLQKNIDQISSVIGSTMTDAKRDLSEASANMSEIKKKVLDTRGSDGTSIGKQISYVTGSVPNYAKALVNVEKAAKDLNVSLGDIMNSKDRKELRMKIEDLKRKAPGSPGVAELTKLDNMITAAYDGKKAASAMGGSADGGLISMEKRMEKQTGTRKSMFRAFSEKSNILFKQMLSGVYEMSKKLGTTIPLSDELGQFVHAFDQMGSIYKEGIEYSLTGYNKNATATEQRERFMGQLGAVISALNSLVGGPGGEMFRAIKTPIEEFQKHIDFYVDRFNLDTGNKIQTRFVEGKAEGGDEDGAEGGAGITQAGMTLSNVGRTLKHFFAVAKMRGNLTKVVSESKKYNKDYDALLGEALSKHIKACNDDYDDFKKALDESSAGNYAKMNLNIGAYYNVISIANTNVKKEWSKETILKMKKTAVDAKIELYKALQAIDMCLMRFSDAAAASPDDIKEVSRMLDSVQIVSEWFNDRSGDSVAGLFEYMPFMMKGFDPIDSNITDTMIDKNKSTLKKSESLHYYKVVEDEIAGTPDSARDRLDYTDALHIVDKKASEKVGSLPGNPFIVISPGRAGFAKEFAQKTVDRIMALKNIVAAFSYLGNKFGDKNIDEDSFMSPGQIYKALCNYLYTSAFVMGWDGYTEGGANNAFSKTYLQADGATPMEGKFAATDIHGGTVINESKVNIGNVGAGDLGKIPSAGGTTINVGVASYASINFDDTKGAGGGGAGGGGAGASGATGRVWAPTDTKADNPDFAAPGTPLKDIIAAPPLTAAAFGCAFNSIPEAEGKSSKGGWHQEFKGTDTLFIVAIKSMVAKVFTVSGLYNMFNYKSRDDHTMSSTRFVLGGADTPANSAGPSHVPEINEKAIELYVRLPLLAEFYKDIFSLDEVTTDGDVISLVPEMDPIWSGIMRLAFDQPRGAAGVVTKNYAARMIKEINGIYARYSGKPNIVSAVVNDFIADVNSRFGIMKRSEAEKYKTEENKRRTDRIGSDPEQYINDFDTLDDDERGHGIAPSDKYGVGVRGSRMSTSTNDFDITFINAISTFRKNVDDKIRKAVYGSNGDGSPSVTEMTGRLYGIPNFYEQVRISQNSMKAAKTPEERFGVVYATIAGLDSSVKRAAETYVLFHEVVAAPLNVLAGVYSALDRFERTVWTNCIGTAAKSLTASTEVYATPGNVGALMNAVKATIQSLVPQRLRDSGVTNDIIGDNLFRPDTYVMRKGWHELPYEKANWKFLATHLNADKVGRKTISFIALWHEKCFKLLTQAILSHATDMGGLVEVMVSGSKITIDHSRLQQYCEDTMAFIRKSIQNFRSVIHNDVLKNYEGSSTIGSIADIQNKLFDDMFYGKNNGGLPKAIKEVVDCYYLFGNKNPEKPGERYWEYDLNLKQGGVAAGPPIAVIARNAGAGGTAANIGHGIKPLVGQFEGWSFDSVMSELVYYYPMGIRTGFSGTMPGVLMTGVADENSAGQGVVFGTNANLAHVKTDDDSLGYALKAPGTGSGGARNYKSAVLAGRYDFYLQKNRGNEHNGFRGDHPTRAGIDDEGNGVRTGIQTDTGEGLLMKFNEVLAKYLEQFWDQSSSKIYKPAIAEFANGPANRAVLQNMGFPDFATPKLSASTDIGVVDVMTTYSTPTHGPAFIKDAVSSRSVKGMPSGADNKIARIGGFIKYETLVGKNSVGPLPETIQDDWYVQSSWATRLGAVIKYHMNPEMKAVGNVQLARLYNKHHETIVAKCMAKPVPTYISFDITDIDGRGFAVHDEILAAVAPWDKAHTDAAAINASVGAAATAVPLAWNGRIKADKFVGTFGTAGGVAGDADTMSANIMKMWCLKACMRLRNNVIGLMGDITTFTDSERIGQSIIDLAGGIISTEKAFHEKRLTNVVNIVRYLDGTLIKSAVRVYNNSSATPGVPYTVLEAVENIPDENGLVSMMDNDNVYYNAHIDNNVGINLNVDIIMREVMDVIENYKNILVSETINGPASVVTAAMFAMDMIIPDMSPIYIGNNAPFGNFPIPGTAAGAAYVGTDIATGISRLTHLTYLGLSIGQIKELYNPLTNATRNSILTNKPDSIIDDGKTEARSFSQAFGLGVMNKANVIDENFNDVFTHTPANVGTQAQAVSKDLGYTVNAELYSWVGGGGGQIVVGVGAGVSAGGPLYGATGPNRTQFNVFLNAAIREINKYIDTEQKLVSSNPAHFQTISDLISSTSIDDKWGNPDEVVFASLSNVMKTMLTEQARGGATPALLWTNLSDVPSGMKENFKANLPIFIKMFSKIGMSANVLKMLLRKDGAGSSLNVSRHLLGTTEMVKKTKLEGIQGQLFEYMKTPNEGKMDDISVSQDYYNFLLDKISGSCEGVIKCATTVLDELGDNPLFLETGENSISSYRNSNNVTPFMPMSSALMGLRNKADSYDVLKPFHLPSGADFGLVYGTRLLLGRPSVKPMLDHAPGMREITEKYNLVTSDPSKQFALETIDNFIGKYIPLLRWISDIRTIGIVGCSSPWIGSADLVGSGKYIDKKISTYALENSVNAVISLTTSSDKNGSIEKVVSKVSGSTGDEGRVALSREDTQVYNIIDLGVNPININALRREIPLVNLLNYAYTFDSFAKDILGNFEIGTEKTEMKINNPLQGLLNFAIHPHAPANYFISGTAANVQSTKEVFDVFGTSPGVNTHGLEGHDKFAINQVLCKALFSSYENRSNALERKGGLNGTVGAGALFYPDPEKKNTKTGGEFASNSGGPTAYLQMIGQMRFDTTFVRNILFISTAHRLMRAKMNNELMKISYPVASGPAAVSSSITEGVPWETWNN